jgi:hypothetical protein
MGDSYAWLRLELVVGNYVVHSNMTLGPVRASGILHENKLAVANSTVSAGSEESGPWRHITSDEVEHRKPEDMTEEKACDKSADLEAQI